MSEENQKKWKKTKHTSLTLDEESSVSLFPYQVSGHGAILKLSGSKICKPVSQRELSFYESVSTKNPELVPFLAQYFGTVDVEFTSSGKVKEMLHDSEQIISSSPNSLSSWNVKLAKKEMKQYIDNKKTVKYIVLQDLSKNYEHPSIIDIKMGTRSHGDDDPPIKIQRKIERAKSSTSWDLGMRIGGHQIYHSPSNTSRLMEKYEGLKLTKEEFMSVLISFFDDGIRMRYELIPLFLEKLRSLLNVIEAGVAYRFYSTSLLLLYEGGSTQPVKADVRMIDFAHTHSYREGLTPRDDGYEFGLKNLIRILEEMLQSKENPNS